MARKKESSAVNLYRVTSESSSTLVAAVSIAEAALKFASATAKQATSIELEPDLVVI